MVDLVQNLIAFGGIPGGWEWIVILIVALLIFGKRLPDLARSVGKSLTEFKKGVNEAKETKDKIVNDVVNEAKDAAGLNDSEDNDTD